MFSEPRKPLLFDEGAIPDTLSGWSFDPLVDLALDSSTFRNSEGNVLSLREQALAALALLSVESNWPERASVRR